jgi:hypothetical protein
VECYKYQSLALSGSDRQLNDREGDAARRKLREEWKYNIGEQVTFSDIFLSKLTDV